MTNKKSTKRSLLFSALSLFLCIGMLAGTTFAWFTDSVSSKNNVIVSGNLDVELYWSIDGKKWDKVDEQDEIFKDETLWEPGHTEVVYLKVVNEGSLALKYQLGVNIVDEKTGTNVAGDSFKLSDYIEFGVKETAEAISFEKREDALTAIKEYQIISAGYTNSSKLGAKNNAQNLASEEYATLVVTMPETVGNVANHNGKDIPFIQLGITLFATQLAAEEDSFDANYDKDAWHPEMKVYSAEDLQAAINNGETNIVLMDNITLTESIVVPAPAATTYSPRTAATVIDLNGNEITSNLTSGRAILVQGAAEIKNGKISTTNGVTGLRATGKSASLTLTDMTVSVTGTGSNAEWNHTAIGAANGATVVINNGTYSAEVGYGLVTMTSGADITINDGTFTTKGTTNSAAVRFDSGWDNSKIYTKAIINGGEFNAPEGGFAFTAINAYGKDITINGGTFNGELDSSYQDNGVVINGGTFNKPILQGGGHQDRYLINGGTFVENVSAKVANGYKAVQNADGTYSVIFPQESFNGLIENAQPGDTIEVPVGNFTLSGNNNLVIVGQGEDTVITFSNSIENTNISNATISGEPRFAVKAGQNAVFNDVTFEGTKAWGSIQGTATFTGCTFSGLFHIDSSAETTTVRFVDCTFDEYSIIKFGGKADYVLEGCVVKALAPDATGAWGKEWVITYCDTTFTDCELGRQVRAGSNINITFNNCVDANEATVTEKIININPYADPILLIDGVPVVFSNDALKTVIDNGATKVMLADGEYDLNGIQKDGLTLIGVGDDVKMANTTKYASGKASGAIWQAINLENMTITNTVYTMADGGKATFTNVNFAAGFRQGYGTGVVFTDCTFGSNSEGYALHFQTDSGDEGGNIVLNGCEFKGGKVHLGGKRVYTFTGCDFATGTDFQVWSGITLNGCSVDGVTVTAANIKTFFPNLNLANVTLDGACVVATSEALNAAVKTNAVISLVPGEYELTATAIGATIKGASEETVRINAAVPIYGFNGKIPVRMHFENLTFTNTMSTFQDTATEETGGTASTFTNVTFEAGFRHGYGSKVVFTDCTFGSNTEGYALHFEYDEVGTAGEIKLTGCKFLGGKVHLGGPRTYAFTNCDFATGTDFQVWTGVTLNGCTVNGVAVTTENISTLFPNLDINQVTVK